jgi:CHAT domain-containing protein
MENTRLMKSRIFVFLMLIFIASTALAQEKYDKMIDKAEGAYSKGDYSGAIKAINKFNKKVSKKLGKQNQYTPTYYLLLAKYNLVSGFIPDFETNLQTAISSSSSIYQPNSLKHALILFSAAELNTQNGAYRIAKDYLNQSNKILNQEKLMTEQIKARWDMAMAEALTGQGYYNESLEILKERESYFAGRAVKQESFVDDKGGLKSRKLSDDEVKQRYHEYANLLTLTANTYGKQGNLRSSDSVFVYAAGWIKKNLNYYSMDYLRNQFYNAVVLTENGNENLPKDLEYDRTLNVLKSYFKPSHQLGIFLYEEYLKQLLREGNMSRYYNTKLEYEKMINKTYAKNSIYKARLNAVEFDSKLNRDKTKNLENDASNVLANSGLPRNNITTTEILDFLYGFSLQEKKYTSAEKYLSDIIDIKTELLGADAPETHLARLHLANFYLDYTNKINEASKIYEESYTNVVAKEIGAWHKDNLDILNHIATLYELTDKFKAAATTLGKASDVARSKYDDKDYRYGEELTNIARLEIKLGQYENAELHINKALTILEEFRKDDIKKIYLINAVETQAVLFGIKGLFDEAEDALDRSAKMISKSDNLVGIDEFSTAKELSSLFIQLGRYSQIERMLDNLIKEYEKLYGNTSLRLVEPLVNKGRLVLAKGDYTEAEKIAQRALTISTLIYTDKSTKTAPVQKLLGSIYYTIGDYEKAEDNVFKAMQSQQREFGGEHIEVAKSLSQLALIKFYKGDNHKEIEAILAEAQTIIGRRVGKDNPQYAEVLKDVAVLYISEKRYDIAFSSLTQAEAIWVAKTGSKRNINAASIYTLTGDVYYQLKNYKKAEEFYNKGKSIYEANFSRNHPEYVKVLSKLSKVYFMEKDFKAAKKNIEESLANYENFIKQFFPALSEREKAKYWNTIKGDFEFYNTLAFGNLEDFRDLTGKVYNYQLLTKALLLSSSIKIRQRILNSQDENLKATYNLWVQKKELLTNALSMSTAQLSENGIDPNALSNEVEALEKQLSVQSELFGQSFENKRITYENVQKSIDKNDVAVEMVRYRHFNHTFTDSIVYVALYVKNDNTRPKAIKLIEGNKLETRYFRYYRNCITGKIPDVYSYKVFWEPIQKEIGQYTTIYLSPDGVYNQINLEAIPTPDGKYIIDNSNIVMVSNTKDLYMRKLKGKQAASTNNATMFGNPTFYLTASSNNRIPSLPGTEKEVVELQDLLKQKGWKTDEYTEGSASEEKVKELDNPKIFHIATHGFYTPATEIKETSDLTENEAELGDNPLLKTGLLLKGAGDMLDKTKYNYNMESGILTAYEAMSLNLDRTDLVVLSACETGLGEISSGEGVYGLQRAFLVAGAKTLIMSMFKVDDDATQKLILNFYRKWLTTGNLRQSFIDAKKELRIDYPDPIYWGAFMMIGLDQ